MTTRRSFLRIASVAVPIALPVAGLRSSTAWAAPESAKPDGRLLAAGDSILQYDPGSEDLALLIGHLQERGFVESRPTCHLRQEYGATTNSDWERADQAFTWMHHDDGSRAVIDHVIEGQRTAFGERPPQAHIWHDVDRFGSSSDPVLLQVSEGAVVEA